MADPQCEAMPRRLIYAQSPSSMGLLIPALRRGVALKLKTRHSGHRPSPVKKRPCSYTNLRIFGSSTVGCGKRRI